MTLFIAHGGSVDVAAAAERDEASAAAGGRTLRRKRGGAATSDMKRTSSTTNAAGGRSEAKLGSFPWRLEAKPSEPRKGRSIDPLAASLDRSLHVFEGANLQGCAPASHSVREPLPKHTVVARAAGKAVWQIAQ